MVFTNKKDWNIWLKEVDRMKFIPSKPVPMPKDFNDKINLLLKRCLIAEKMSNTYSDFYEGP